MNASNIQPSMSHKKHIAATLAAIITLLSIAGCDTGYDCNLNNTSYENIGFYTNDGEQEEPYTNPEPLSVSLMINGAATLVVNNITDAAGVSLPMSYTQAEDTVVFNYHDDTCDSLYVKHTAHPYFQSMECGVLMFHKIEDIRSTNVWIEDVKVVNKNVNFEGNENIKIYFYR